jgi:hypothetical protein
MVKRSCYLAVAIAFLFNENVFNIRLAIDVTSYAKFAPCVFVSKFQGKALYECECLKKERAEALRFCPSFGHQ